MNLIRKLRNAPAGVWHLFGKKKKAAPVSPKVASIKPRAGKVLPFRRSAPKPAPQQRPAEPKRKAAELTADQVKAIRQRERDRCRAIFEHGARIGKAHLAAALAFETRMAAPAAVRLLDDLKQIPDEPTAGSSRNIYVPRGTAA